jgi:hypothetical protein
MGFLWEFWNNGCTHCSGRHLSRSARRGGIHTVEINHDRVDAGLSRKPGADEEKNPPESDGFD